MNDALIPMVSDDAYPDIDIELAVTLVERMGRLIDKECIVWVNLPSICAIELWRTVKQKEAACFWIGSLDDSEL